MSLKIEQDVGVDYQYTTKCKCYNRNKLRHYYTHVTIFRFFGNVLYSNSTLRKVYTNHDGRLFISNNAITWRNARNAGHNIATLM